ncbi:hypothetical protein HRbin36_02796 [bacterium HR36]|nr:hypothetical protein HRbin36_02796 [bacterium HR36]
MEIAFRPINLVFAAARLFAFELLFEFEQDRVFGVFGNRLVFFAPAVDADIVLVSQGEDVTMGVKLWASCPAENLMGGAGVNQFLFAWRPFDQCAQDDASRREVDACR